MKVWRWISQDIVFAVHDRQISEHSGGDGVRDRAAVESALARPQNLAAYAAPDAAALAAAYAFGLSRNHGFIDGNKRTAWVIAHLFLADNGYRLTFKPAEAVRAMEALAEGTLDEAALAAWFRERVEERGT
jgi:death-on-curing protein